MRLWTGPGYFVAYRPPEGAVLIDYERLPGDKPPAWPAIVPNSARLGRFVYAGMKDVLHRVSRGVAIGRARKGDHPMDAWFVLVRRTVVERAAGHGR
jgi:hypothetical protein